MTDVTNTLAENIRLRRRELHMTQGELAARLGYSAKAISKWEQGGGTPPTVLLPALANALRTNIDDLMTAPTKKKYFLGIDGGGTKTEFALADADGTILRSVILGTSNPSDVGIDAALNVLRAGITEVCERIPLGNVSLFAGLAGGSTEGIYEQLSAFFSRFGFEKVAHGSDAMNAVAAGLGASDGIAVIMGTGSVTFAKCKGKTYRVGGYGYLLGDAGSGFALGSEAIHGALSFEDGSGEETMLYDLVKEACGTERVLDSLGAFYSGGKRTIAQYAPLLLKAYLMGDAVAERILLRNMEAVARTIRGASKRLPENGEAIKVALCGGLCTKEDTIANVLRPILSGEGREYSVTICKEPMINGALRLAGVTPKTETEERAKC